MKFTQETVKRLGILAVVLSVLQYALSSYVYPYIFGEGAKQVFGIFPITQVDPYTAIGSLTFGDKVLGYLTGAIPINFGGFTVYLSMLIGAFVLLYAGYWLYEKMPIGKNVYQKLWAVLFYGTAILYVVLLMLKTGSPTPIALPLLIGVAVNYLILALVTVKTAEYVEILRI